MKTPSKMDRYQKVEKPRAEQPINENEIRITSQGRTRNYITYAMSLLQDKGSSEIVFKAMGRAINKTVTIVELIKRRIVGLHQITSIGSTDITDTWEPLEEGLLPIETTRHVSMIIVTLSKEELNTSSIGYQPPLPADQVKVATEFEYDGEVSPTARGRGRGGRGRGRRSRAMPGESEDVGWDAPPEFTRGRGRGRGRNFRGRGRGSYNNNGAYVDDQYDGAHNQEASSRQGRGEYEDAGWDAPRDFPRGRGRGRGRNFRGRGRGSYDNNGAYANDQYDGGYNQEAPMQQGRGEYEDAGWDAPRDFPRGRGRGRGRNFRGRGRGSYDNNGAYANDQYDGGYNQEAPMQQGRGEYEDAGWDAPRDFPRGRGRGRGRNFRGRGRGSYDNNGAYANDQYDGGYNQEAPMQQGRGGESEDVGWDAPRDFTRGRGRGGGRNFRGRGRGGYNYNNGSYVDDQYDGGYNQEAPMQQGRGRGRGRGSRGRGRGFRSNGPIQAGGGGGM
ncbi:hypothetical protein L1987_46288 [Smallanthus sonchifolius]|uniref:Uncharacterized protein n=1 Tax=Smallanthus sonchifolius TaxID=185202 RepID=A0ACB9FZY6_9ASTR|nr:hypothetical protein L1987_46288 [Smallanthus sonchifolius]